MGDDPLGAHRLDNSILQYQGVMRVGAEGGGVAPALYGLAWCHLDRAETLEDYDRSLSLFGDLLDWSERRERFTGEGTAETSDALKGMGIALSREAQILDERWTAAEGARPTGLMMLERYLATRQSRSYEDELVRALAEALAQQGQREEAITTLKFYLSRWPEGEHVAESLAAVAVQYHRAADMALQEKDLIRAASLVGATSPTPDAIRAASMARYHEAAALYQEYLDRFPSADDSYEFQSYLAAVLVNTGQLPQAEEVYEQLVKAGDHPYHDSALWQLMQVRRERLVQKYGTVQGRPADAVEEQRVPLPSGAERVIYQIDEDHVRFIAVADQLVAAQFTDKDYAQALAEFRPALAYIPAEIQYNYGHLDDARRRFEAIIDAWPGTITAMYAANLMLDSYGDEEDLARVRDLILSCRYCHLGPESDEYRPEPGPMGYPQVEVLAYKKAEALKDQDRAAAADAFVAFLAEFPKSQYASKALYNAANSYDIIGRIDDANRLFEQYLNMYPRDERSAQLFYRLADNYSSVLELDKAVRYYETLVANFPDFPDASGALYNAAFLRIGLGDAEGAAKNFERYAQQFPARADAEYVFFLAGDQWRKVGDAQLAAFYQRYLRAYPDANPEHALEAWYQLAKLAEKTGNPRVIDLAWARLSAACARLAPTGAVGPAGRHYAAAADLHELDAELSALKVYTFTTDEAKIRALIKAKRSASEALIVKAEALIADYQDFETSSAAMLVQAEAHFTLADLVSNAPCPASFKQERCELFKGELDQARSLDEAQGTERLQAVLALADQEKRWSEWQDSALSGLHARDPGRYGAALPVLRAEVDSGVIRESGAIDRIRPR